MNKLGKKIAKLKVVLYPVAIIRKLFKPLFDLFVWSSGADARILDQVPTEKSKYYGIGGTIVFTALMATFAGGYAIHTAFQNIYISIPFAIFWGALIFNLDRYIVSTFGVGDGKKTISKQELIEAAPRLAMAIILGFVIATPLELKLFEKEINAQIDKDIAAANKSLEAGSSITSNVIVLNYQEELNELKEAVQSRESILSQKRQEYENADEAQRKEWLGEGSTGKSGKGPLWVELNDKAERLLRELEEKENEYKALNQIDRTRITELQGLISEDEEQRTETIESRKRIQAQTDGLLSRLKALDSLTSENSTLFAAKWLITIMFIFIEIAPILFKMMTERGPYDDILDRIKYETKVDQMLLQSNLNEEINTQIKINSEKNELKIRAEMEANKDLMQQILNAQTKVAEVAIQNWKKNQMKKVKLNPELIIKTSRKRS